METMTSSAKQGAPFIPILVSLVILNCNCQSEGSAVTWQKSLNYGSNEIFEITIGNYGYPYLDVLVNGEPVTMAFDTGNMAGILISPDVAERLQLKKVGESKHYDSSGQQVGTAHVFEIGQLEVFGKVWQNERAHEHKSNLNGLIGPRFLIGKRFTLDYRNRRMAVSETPLPLTDTNKTTLPLIASPDHEGLILVQGTVNGYTILMELDTGKSRTVVDPVLVKILNLTPAARGYRIDEITLGPYSFSVASAKEVSLKGISTGLPELILLSPGSDLLSQIILSVDYSQQRVMIRSF